MASLRERAQALNGSRSPARGRGASPARSSLLDRSRALSAERGRGDLSSFRSPARTRSPAWTRSPARTRSPDRRSSLASRAETMSGRPDSPARASLRRAQAMSSSRGLSSPRRGSIGSRRSSLGAADRRSGVGADTRDRALAVLRSNAQGSGDQQPERTVSTAHLDGAVSPGKAAKNPQELVAFLRAKRKSGGQTPRREPSTAGSIAQAPAPTLGGSPPPPPPMNMMMGGPSPMHAAPPGPPGPPPPLPPGGMLSDLQQAVDDRTQRVAVPQAGNPQLLSEIEQAAQARAAARQVPQAGPNNQLLSEIEQAAQARAAQRQAQQMPQVGGNNPLLEEIRAAGGSPRGRINQWLTQGDNRGVEQPEEIQLGESAVSPVMTASRSASPPPPSAAAYSMVRPEPDDGPVNHVQELLMQNGLIERKQRSVVSAHQSQHPSRQSQQDFGHVAKLLMRHELHDVEDPAEVALQMQQESMRALETIQTYPSLGHLHQPVYPTPQQQPPPPPPHGLGQVPAAPAPQPSIWEKMHNMAQTQSHPHPQQMGMLQQHGAQGPGGMTLPHSIRAPVSGHPGQLMPTTSTYQTMPGRSTFAVRLQKKEMPGGRWSFGMKINWNEQHRRIEVTEVVESALPYSPTPISIYVGTHVHSRKMPHIHVHHHPIGCRRTSCPGRCSGRIACHPDQRPVGSRQF